MRPIRLTTESGYSWETCANGTKEELERYFVGAEFNTACYPGEQMETCVKLEILE